MFIKRLNKKTKYWNKINYWKTLIVLRSIIIIQYRLFTLCHIYSLINTLFEGNNNIKNQKVDYIAFKFKSIDFNVIFGSRRFKIFFSRANQKEILAILQVYRAVTDQHPSHARPQITSQSTDVRYRISMN